MPGKENSRPRPDGYYFLTPVWGETYIRLYMDVSIPSQLSQGNLPVFADSPTSRYVIFTRPEDEHLITGHPNYQKLSEHIQVNIEYLPDADGHSHMLMSLCHKLGIAMADANNCAALFLNPDLIFADGSFRTVREKCEEGYDTVIVPGIRTLKQGVLHALEDELKRSPGVLTMDSRRLMRIALNNLHPLGDSSWWEEEVEADLIPANLYWRAGDEGIVARCFHLHPLMVYPQHKGAVFFGTIDDDYMVAACPDGQYEYVVTDSDELLAIELSDPGHLFLTGFRKESLEDAATWAEQFTHQRHRIYFDSVIRMHTGMNHPDIWAAAEAKAEKVAEQIKDQLKRSSWELFKSDTARLKRRLIRWSMDHEIARANGMHKKSFALKHGLYAWLYDRKAQSPAQVKYQLIFEGGGWRQNVAIFLATHLFYLKVVPAKAILSYYNFIWKFARFFGAIKRKIYGKLWQPYPWTWRYRYFTELRGDMVQVVRHCAAESSLLIAFDEDNSLIKDIYGKHFSGVFGYFHHNGQQLHILSKNDSSTFEPERFDTIFIERALPSLKHLEEAVKLISQLLAPRGKVVMLVNRVPSPADRLEQEICATVSAVSQLLKPDLKVIEQKKQGRVTSGMIHVILHWIKVRSMHLRIPFIFIAVLSIVFAPINIAVALMGNVIACVFDLLDNTERFYVSSITTAQKVNDMATDKDHTHG